MKLRTKRKNTKNKKLELENKKYKEIIKNYYKTIMYLKNKLNSNVLEYGKAKELNDILKMLEV